MGLQRVGHDVLTEQHPFDQIRAPAPKESLSILTLHSRGSLFPYSQAHQVPRERGKG